MKDSTKPNYPSWSDSLTFKQWVIKMFEEKQTDSEEFKRALIFFGRKRLVEIWKEYKKDQK